MGKLIKNDLCSWSTASTKALFRFIQYSASVIGFGFRAAAASNPVGIQNLLVIRYSLPLPHQDVGVVSRLGRINSIKNDQQAGTFCRRSLCSRQPPDDAREARNLTRKRL